MRKVIWKAYYNYEKEEKWLNEMSAMGWALVQYTWCRYVFEQAEENEYIYRLELLDELASHPKSQHYIEFLEDNGVEYVSAYLKWIYVRKKASDGSFDIYTDIDSKIEHSKKVYKFWLTFMFIELTIGLSNIVIGFSNYQFNRPISTLFSFNVVVGFALVFVAYQFFRLSIPMKQNINKLNKEKLVRE